MLKRQRQSSPPPSSSVPFIADDIMVPTEKRRRILPPVLDGAARGQIWDQPEDEGEEDDDESPVEAQWPAEPSSSMYKSANSVLHDLHALHRHRLIFSNANFNPDAPYDSSPGPSTSSDKTFISPRPHHPHHHVSPTKSVDHSSPPAVGGPENLSVEEQRVKERYEDTNKLLRSVFLSRRRELEQ